MKKLCLILLGLMVLLSGSVYADEVTSEEVIVEEVLELDEIIEDIEEELHEDEILEQALQAKYADYEAFTNEFRHLAEARLVGAKIKAENHVKKVTIDTLKIRSKLKGQDFKLDIAKLIEKEIHVVHQMNKRINGEKEILWTNFEEQVNEGNIDDAEITLRKIVVLKKLVNENLKHIQSYLDIEISVLN